MEDAGVLVTLGGIFLGIYFVLKATAQLLAMRRAQQTQEAAVRQGTEQDEASDAEPNFLKDN